MLCLEIIKLKKRGDILSIKIINSPTTNVEQMKAWARSKGAYEFEKLAEPCYLASKMTGVDPAVSYALSAKETGWCYKNGRSQAGIDATYHNPAGLKVTRGGSDFDRNAHMRFKDWYDGYLAQQEHLALYAGANGYPKTNPLDPRHFVYLLGRAKTVVELGGKNKWNSNPDYGVDVERLIKDLYSTPYTPKQNNNVKEVVVTKEKMKIVAYNGDADVFSAIILSQKLKCPLIKLKDINEKDKDNFEIVQVGGKEEDTDRYQTFKNVAKLI